MSNFETCELYPGAELYKPQLVLKTPPNASELMASGNYIAQKKKDGYWYCLVKTAKGNIYLFSRSKSKKTGFYSEKIDNVPHIKEWAENLPNDTMLVGEIYYPGKTSKDVTTIMGCLAEKAVMRQKDSYGYIYYYIHDILRYDGKDYVQQEIDFAHRYYDLNNYNKKNNWEGLENTIEIAAITADLDMEDTIVNWMECGEEGAVVRLKSSIYEPGKRNKNMWKIKQDSGDLDFIVTGFIAPEQKYTGKEIEIWPYWEEISNGRKHYLKPGVKIKTPCIPVTKAYFYNYKMGVTLGLLDNHGNIIDCGKCTSGFTDADREDMAKSPNKYFNQCITVGAMSVDKKEKSLRHPRFIKWHQDKPIEDCTVEGVFE